MASLASIASPVLRSRVVNSKSDTTTIWKGDGSLVIIQGAEKAGYVVKGDDSGSEIEYFVIPKDDVDVNPRVPDPSVVTKA